MKTGKQGERDVSSTVTLLAALVLVPGSLIGHGVRFAVACPTDMCVCIAEEDIDCSEMFLTRLPDFFPSPTNTTYVTIDLSFNRIRRLGRDAFRFVRVKQIKLWHNSRRTRMNISSRALRGLEDDLKEITIRKSNITSLPAGLFSNLSRLVAIDMPQNLIKEIRRGTFRDAGSVEKLNLEENLLPDLSENVFSGLSGLKDLKLAKNKIIMIDSKAFQALTNLESLSLRNNRIRDLQPKVFSSLTQLKRLDLANNSIPALFPLMFTGLQSLDSLILTNNPIIMIARQTFSSMVNLKELHLEKCKLTYLKPGVFDGLVNLRALSIYKNELKSLPDGLFFNLRGLREVQLEANKLETINACAFEDISAIKKIFLYDNPIHCDCTMAWTSLQLKTGTKVIGNCTTPEVIKGQEIAHAHKYHVCRYNGLEVCTHLRKPHANDVTRFKYFRHI